MVHATGEQIAKESLKKERKWWILFFAPLLIAIAVIWYSASGLEPTLTSALSIFIVLCFLSVIAAFEVTSKGWPARRIMTLRVVLFSSILAVCAIPFTHWPLRTSVRIWDRPLREIHSRFARGEHVETPIRVGPFWIHKLIMVRPGMPGIVLEPDRNGETSLLLSDEVPGNAWSSVSLHGDWILYSED